jgi:4-oxalocrotonate tautomerase
MPHVIVKLHSGRSKQQKDKLAAEVTKAVIAALKADEGSISVAIEDIEPKDWAKEVYKPDILAKPDTIYKAPGYNPL